MVEGEYLLKSIVRPEAEVVFSPGKNFSSLSSRPAGAKKTVLSTLETLANTLIGCWVRKLQGISVLRRQIP